MSLVITNVRIANITRQSLPVVSICVHFRRVCDVVHMAHLFWFVWSFFCSVSVHCTFLLLILLILCVSFVIFGLWLVPSVAYVAGLSIRS
jgi:hypothetical protein